MSDLVLYTFGFKTIEHWKNDTNLGELSELDLMELMDYKSLDEWRAAVANQRRETQKALLGAISKLWKAIGKTPDPAQLEVYFHEFEGYPPERIEDAVSQLIRTRKWSNVPSIAEIYGALN